MKPKELETKWIRWWAVAVAVVVVVVVVSQPAGHGWPAILAGLSWSQISGKLPEKFPAIPYRRCAIF